MFLKPVDSVDSEYNIVSLHGGGIKVIRLPKYKHQDNTDKFSVAIVLVHNMSIPPYSYNVSPYGNSFLAYGKNTDDQEVKDQVKNDFCNSFTVLYEKEFGRDEIINVQVPFVPILDKLWDAIKNGSPYFDFNEHVDAE